MAAYVPGASNATIPQIVRSLKEQASGRSNATGNVTLRPSQTTTVVTNDNFVKAGCVVLCPLTASAAAAHASIYFDVNAMGAFTIHHPSNPATDQVFVYAIIG